MADLLVRLYGLPHFEAEERVAAAGIVVRRALPPERLVVHTLDQSSTRSPTLGSTIAG